MGSIARKYVEATLAGDEDAILALIADDFVEEWPQTGERVRGPQGCLDVIRNYPGGPPNVEFGRISGEGDHWVIESTATYPADDVYHVMTALELREGKIVRQVEVFGPAYPAPEWRKPFVEPII